MRAARRSARRAAPAGTVVAPQLATLVDEVPRGEDWVHEIKFDGYRIICRLRHGRAQLISRNGKDWTDSFAAVARAAEGLGVKDVVLDGEVVSLAGGETSSFQSLQNALSRGGGQLAYYVFDILELDGEDLTDLPLVERKEALKKLLARGRAKSGPIRYADHVVGRGRELFREACRTKLEGIISKRARGAYRPGRGHDWLKIKCHKEQELVIAGFTDPQGGRTGFGSLILAVNEDGKLRYAGRVGTGFSRASLDDLYRKLKKLVRETSPLSDGPKAGAKGVHFVEPKLVAQVAFTEWTTAGHLRHPSFKGLRSDKPASAVVREEETPVAKAARAAPARKARRRRGHLRLVPPPDDRPPRAPRPALGDGPVTVAGQRLTHPHRILWTKQGVTKHELARYVEAVAEHMLPYVSGRPLTLVRCPDGANRQCFYQKHATDSVPESVSRITLRESRGRRTYMMVEDAAGLVGLVQIGALEAHVWGSRHQDLEHPDTMVFDLDPAPHVPWARVVAAAKRVRALLKGLGLESFLKTTGGKGLHVTVPLAPRHSWTDVKEFSRMVAKLMVREEPKRYIASAGKAARAGKIFIDWLRNARGATYIAPYATRAHPGATVAMPVCWDALDELRPDSFNVRNALAHIEERGDDPWDGYFDLRQVLSDAMRRKLR